MNQKKKLQGVAAVLIIWLATVSCKIDIKMPDFFGGVSGALENMFRSIGGSFGF